MDESREGIEYQREIDEALASQMSPEEEEEVLKELEALQKEQMVGLARIEVVVANGSPRSPTCPRPIRCTCRTRRPRSRPRQSRHKRVSLALVACS
jgi:charged multivesicular body protein 6